MLTDKPQAVTPYKIKQNYFESEHNSPIRGKIDSFGSSKCMFHNYSPYRKQVKPTKSVSSDKIYFVSNSPDFKKGYVFYLLFAKI
jgi:hypothetical protein